MFFARALRLAFLPAAFALFFASCSGRSEKSSSQDAAAKGAEGWQGEKSIVLVLAGQDFPEESGIASLLSLEYGLAEENGLARILYWPRSFEERDSSIRLFSSIAQEEAPEIVVAIGAPEGTLRELNRIRGEFPKIRIASVFPSDEAIPTEAVSDMVIDMDIAPVEAAGVEGEMVAEEETELDIAADEAALLLLAAVFSMEMIGGEEDDASAPLSELFEEGMRFAEISAAKAGNEPAPPSWEFRQAIDPDTGLRSRRHVLLRRAEP